MTEGKAGNALVMVKVGIQDRRNPDGSRGKKTVYSLMKLSTADEIGVPAELRLSGITDDVVISKGAAAGAIYKRPVKGARGISWKFVFPGTEADATTGKKRNGKPVNVGFPSGTKAETVLDFAKKIDKKPVKVITPKGVTHHLQEA